MPDVCDVPIGVGDVLAGRAAVVLVRCAADVVFGGAELAERFCGVEHAGHAAAGEDLWEWVGDQVAGVSRAAQDAAGERVLGGGDAVAVGVRGRAADGFAFGERAVVLGQGVQAQEPVFVGVLVREAGVVGSGVSEGDLDLQVAVLDRAGDEPARAADDVPGEGAPAPGQRDRAVRVRWNLFGVEVLVAGVVVDPVGQGGEVVGEFLSGAAFSEA
ncbi:hypothetical protein ACQEUX_02885 [Micromonospora sp. CA-259024]|uniref:hypothetical protein n=1 Tax=Micromonospora sp. CA-259024 TaxID=3239965 RepID=UPI003D8E7611